MKHNVISPIAGRVIAKCGGKKQAAELAGVRLATVYKWTYPRNRSKGGTGGTIPRGAQETLLKAAKAGLVDLTPADFYEGWQ